jgi:hypothetical protein
MRNIAKTSLCALLLGAAVYSQTTINGGRTVLGRWDASNALKTLPVKTGSADPVSCEPGEMFVNTSAAPPSMKYCSAANAWVELGGAASPPATARFGVMDTSGSWDVYPDMRIAVVEDEFLATNALSRTMGALGWAFPTGTTVTGIPGVWPAFGAYQLGTAASATATSGISLPDTGNTTNTVMSQMFQNTNKVWSACWAVRPDDSTNVRYMIGFNGGGVGTVPPSSGFYVEYNTAAGSTGWRINVRQDSADNLDSTNLGSFVEDQWSTFCFRSDGAANEKVWVRLNGGTERSICRSGCDVNVTGGTNSVWTANLGPTVSVRTGDSTSKSVSVDAFKAIFYVGGSSRWQRYQ